MIYGVGIDIVNVSRMKEAVDRWGERFLKRVFTENEIAHCYEKKNPFPSLSVRFAAKEAVIKAIGSRISAFTTMEILNDPHGKPFMRTSGKLEAFFREHSLQVPHVSLSHEKEYGIAFVVLEKDSE
jgi:holo-[acyl-carrier protein] synthase